MVVVRKLLLSFRIKLFLYPKFTLNEFTFALEKCEMQAKKADRLLGSVIAIRHPRMAKHVYFDKVSRTASASTQMAGAGPSASVAKPSSCLK